MGVGEAGEERCGSDLARPSKGSGVERLDLQQMLMNNACVTKLLTSSMDQPTDEVMVEQDLRRWGLAQRSSDLGILRKVRLALAVSCVTDSAHWPP